MTTNTKTANKVTKPKSAKTANPVATKIAKKPTTETTKPETKSKPTTKVDPAGTMSQMAAAERVLAEAGEPLNSKALVEAMSAKGYWTSPSGKTPAATLYASLLRHIQKHGKAARFVKTDRGLFTLASR